MKRIAIVGGGASGTILAIDLLRLGGVDVTVFEPGPIGHGVAYSTTDERHLLNVRANNMSAFPDRPNDLLDWARETGRDLAPSDFLPRRDYAHYLRDRLSDAEAGAAGSLHIVRARATDVVPDGGRFDIAAATDIEESAHGPYDAVVLAYGNPAPRRLAVSGVDTPDAKWSLPDPWDVARIAALKPDATIVLIGTGLTAVDTALTLLNDGAGRRVYMASRTGLLPGVHVDAPAGTWEVPVPTGPLTADSLFELIREQIAAAAEVGVDWRAVIDGLRGQTQEIWASLSTEERQRFLDKYARDWEVRRHRMAPTIAAQIAEQEAEGRLSVHSGGVEAIVAHDANVTVTLGDGTTVQADAVINCTGPHPDITRSDNPLLIALVDRGLIAPDPLRLGIDSTPDGDVLGPDGQVVPELYVLGPPRKGVLYETTAIPEIRVQAAELAASLCRAGEQVGN